MFTRKRSLVLALMILLFAAPVRAAEWKWEIMPYLWGRDVSVDVLVDDMQIASQTVEFGDLIDKLDIGALVHFEGRRDRWGLFVELAYLEVSDDQTITGHPLFTDGTRVGAELEQLLWEVGAAVRVAGGDEGLDILFGVRALDISVDINFDFPVIADQSRARDETWVDGFAGVRYRGNIGERWLWWARADAGSGDTDRVRRG